MKAFSWADAGSLGSPFFSRTGPAGKSLPGRPSKPIGYQAVAGVIRRHTDLDTISGHHFYAIFFHAARQNGSNHHVVAAFYFEGSTSQNPGDRTLDLNQIVPAHETPFPAENPACDCKKTREGNPLKLFSQIGEIFT
jgi:hypothetical protein